MNITLQTNNLSTPKFTQAGANNKNIRYNVQPSFSGITPPTKSTFLSPVNGAFDKFTDEIAKFYTKKLYGSRFAEWLSEKTDNLKNVVDHMQVLGSTIISGMYMSQTLMNKDFDEKRKKTLAINQFLTFLVATVLGYTIDKKIDNQWDNLISKYAIKRSGDKDLMKKFDAYKTKCEEIAKAAGEKPKKITLIDYFKDEKEIAHYDLNLAKKINGMKILKSLIVFGTIYRYLSPVAVTPLATWIGNKFVHQENKEAKKTA